MNEISSRILLSKRGKKWSKKPFPRTTLINLPGERVGRSYAQGEAQRFRHNYIGTEHALLGLIRVEDGVAARVLNALGIELGRIRSDVEFITGRGDRVVLGEVGVTPRMKKVIELSVDEAQRLGHRYIGTEHILLGLVREGEGIAAGVLQHLGVQLEQIREKTLEALKENQPHRR
ncbi:MAG TPA: Clp protease N-terminal domain-containing protein [Ktedonobacteraceae bacterium]|jgi:ATP-dependent Clp protease ATP-binding subunit ClpC